MNKANKMALVYGMMAMTGGLEDFDRGRRQTVQETDRDRELKAARVKQLNGLREFFYKDCTVSVLALNQKNADKKAKKKGWI